MHILHVVPTYIPAWRYGGPIHSVHGLCKGLAARGHAVDVATTNVDGDQNSDVPLAVPMELDGVNVHYFPSSFLRRIYYSPPLERYVSSSIHQWDVVHTHSVFLWPTTAAARAARASGKPYVVSPRGMLVKQLIERRNSLAKRAWIALFENRNIANAAAVHVTSRVEGDDLLSLGIHPRRIFEVPNGFDPPEEHEPHDDALTSLNVPRDYVLFLGRISWKKGIDRLLRAVALSPGVNLVVAGNDEEGYWPSMARLAAELSITDRVFYVGFAGGHRKSALISRAAMLALPSYSENFGNVVLEAMALGTPVIVTPEVGLAKTVQDSQSGLVAAGDPPAFASALSKIMGDPAVRRSLGENGRRAAHAFTWDAVAARMESEYRSICGQTA